jgi:membrane-bound ClpP family serine protease
MFLLLGILLLYVLPSPSGLVSLLACFALFADEVAFWHRRVRTHRVAVGAETLIGARGTAIADCRPEGQIRLRGEIWDVRCPDRATRGDAVVVTAQEDLWLVVERESTTSSSFSSRRQVGRSRRRGRNRPAQRSG